MRSRVVLMRGRYNREERVYTDTAFSLLFEDI